MQKKNFEIFNNSYEFSKYLIHFWSASEVVDSSSLRQISMHFFRWLCWSKHFTSSVSTPLFIRNWIHGSTSFWFGGLLNVVHIKQVKWTIGFVHLFRKSVHMFYIQFIPAQNLSQPLWSSCLHFSASVFFNFMGRKF
jgi:hypothetical protein